ncbi:hypothetical protein [Amycolatopsis jejuensis]|nr:hypothetical protein [Amycolatopsis jejuensis]
MSHPDDSRATEIEVILPVEPPELTPAAVRSLLALLLELVLCP